MVGKLGGRREAWGETRREEKKKVLGELDKREEQFLLGEKKYLCSRLMVQFAFCDRIFPKDHAHSSISEAEI